MHKVQINDINTHRNFIGFTRNYHRKWKKGGSHIFSVLYQSILDSCCIDFLGPGVLKIASTITSKWQCMYYVQKKVNYYTPQTGHPGLYTYTYFILYIYIHIYIHKNPKKRLRRQIFIPFWRMYQGNFHRIESIVSIEFWQQLYIYIYILTRELRWLITSCEAFASCIHL